MNTTENPPEFDVPGAVLGGALVDEALVGADEEHGVVVGIEGDASSAICGKKLKGKNEFINITIFFFFLLRTPNSKPIKHSYQARIMVLVGPRHYWIFEWP